MKHLVAGWTISVVVTTCTVCCVYLYEGCLCVGLCCMIRNVGMYHFLEVGIYRLHNWEMFCLRTWFFFIDLPYIAHIIIEKFG